MQPIKDSFFMTLCGRLAEVNPSRVTGEAQRPAVLVCENATEKWLAAQEVFYLRWLGRGTVTSDAEAARWRSLRCEIGYRTEGSEIARGEDRGRRLAAMDNELRRIASPRSASLQDYTTDPATSLGGVILWNSPKFGDAKDDAHGLQRMVELEVLWREDA